MHRKINKDARGHLADPLYRALRLFGTDLLTGGLGTRSSTTRTYVFSMLGRKYGFWAYDINPTAQVHHC